MRAEARWFTGDKVNAIADINAVRAASGGLGASSLTAGSRDARFIQGLLYERRYSLMLEGFRWVDFGRFNLIQTLPKDLPTHFIAVVEPIRSRNATRAGKSLTAANSRESGIGE